jgi:DNA-binding LacI/PurR family transcriptional regulator
MRANVTATDVASLAKVSQSAVSRTFTPGASVSEETREKVLKAARTLGYRPTSPGRGPAISRSRSCIVALVISYLDNQFYPLVIEKLSQKLQRHGYRVLMFISGVEETDCILNDILQYPVDGVIMASVKLSPTLAARCTDSGVPVVLFNRLPDVSAYARHATSSVTSDNARGGRLAAEHLLARGHERIAFLAGLEESSTNVDRERGFRETLEAAGQALHRRAVGHYDFERAKQATRELFAAQLWPDALFIANDHMAIAALDVLRSELGVRVPHDVSVVGFDNVPQSAWDAYGLTTISQSIEAMVSATVDILLEQLYEGGPPRNVVVPCCLVERRTVR